MIYYEVSGNGAEEIKRRNRKATAAELRLFLALFFTLRVAL